MNNNNESKAERTWPDLSSYNLALWYDRATKSFVLAPINKKLSVDLNSSQINDLKKLGFSRKKENTSILISHKPANQASIIDVFPKARRIPLSKMLVTPFWSADNTTVITDLSPQFLWKNASDNTTRFALQSKDCIQLSLVGSDLMDAISLSELNAWPPFSHDGAHHLLIDTLTPEHVGRFDWIDMSAHGVKLKWYCMDDAGHRQYALVAFTDDQQSLERLERLGFTPRRNQPGTFLASPFISLQQIQDAFPKSELRDGVEADIFFSYKNSLDLTSSKNYDKIRLELMNSSATNTEKPDENRNNPERNVENDAREDSDRVSFGGRGDAERDFNGGGKSASDQFDAGVRGNAGDRGESSQNTGAENLGTNLKPSRAELNIRAIKHLKFLELDGRSLHWSDKEILNGFTGWGGLGKAFREPNGLLHPGWEHVALEVEALLLPAELSAAKEGLIDAFYTPQHIIESMYAALGDHIPRKIMEPSVGVGSFLRFSPFDTARFVATEMDGVSSRIASMLYPKAHISNKPFQSDLHELGHVYDLVIGNPPFSQDKVFDSINPHLSANSPNIHSYFINKSLEKLAPGGVGAFVVSRYFLDSSTPAAVALRESLALRFDLAKAIRLPGEAFSESNTEVVTDILFFQKKLEPLGASAFAPAAWVNAFELTSEEDGKPVYVNEVFSGTDTRGQVMGLMRIGSGRFGPALYIDGIENWQEELRDVCSSIRFPKPLHLVFSEKLVDEVNIINDTSFPVCSPLKKEGSIILMKDDKNQDVLGIRLNYQKASWKQSIGYTPIRIANKGEDNKPFFTDTHAYYLVSEQAYKRLVKFIPLRDAFFAVNELEQTLSAEDTHIIHLERDRLNALYDDFVQEFGFLNSRVNQSSLSHDGSLSIVTARLEVNFAPGVTRAESKKTGETFCAPTCDKGDILLRRVIFPEPVEIIYAATASDALSLSMGRMGRIDPGFMVEAMKEYDVSWDVIRGELQGKIMVGYLDGEESRLAWVLSNEFTSGDLVEKMARLKSIIDSHDNGLVRQDEVLFSNIRDSLIKLKETMPPRISFEDIGFTPNAQWAPEWVLHKFLDQTIGLRGILIEKMEINGTWIISSANEATHERDRYTTTRCGSKKMVSAFLNESPPTVYDVIDNAQGGKVRTPNIEETAMARSRFDTLMEEWDEYLAVNDDVQKAVEDSFNEKFNRFAPIQTSGEFYTFSNMNPNFKLRPSQRHAVRCVLKNNEPTLLAHAVGAGKTAIAIASFMEGRKTGVYEKGKKCMIVAPNGLEGQWVSAISTLYPSASVISMSRVDRASPHHRAMFFSKIASTNDVDFVVVPSSQFDLLARNRHFDIELIREKIEDYSATLIYDKASIKNKELESKIRRFKSKLETLVSRSKENTLSLDALGLVVIFFDESDRYKNTPYDDEVGKLRGLKGLGNPAGSARAEKHLAQVLHAESCGIKVVEMTGTPEVNSLIEVYLNLKRIASRRLRELEILGLSQFINLFCEKRTSFAYTASGYKEITSIAGYKNLNVLRGLVGLSRDTFSIKTVMELSKANGEASFDIPEATGGGMQNSISELNDLQRQIIGEQIDFDKTTGEPIFTPYSVLARISEFSRQTSKKPSAGEDNMLSLIHLGKAALLDPSLVKNLLVKKMGAELFAQEFGHADFNELSPKIKSLTEQVYASWLHNKEDRGVQLIYSDIGTPKKKGLSSEGLEIKKALESIEMFESHPDNEKLEAAAELANEFLSGYTEDEINDLTDESQDLSVYEKIKNNLIKLGIPAHEIEFIQDHDGEKRETLLGKLRSGQVRVCIGSTSKMSAGMNVQDLITDIHFLTTPYTPRDLVQSMGRALRQGHRLLKKYGAVFTVNIVRHGMRHYLDAMLSEILRRKEALLSGALDPRVEISDTKEPDELINPGAMISAVVNNNINEDKVFAEGKVRGLNAIHRSISNDKKNQKGKLDNAHRIIATYAEHEDAINELMSSLVQSKTRLRDARDAFDKQSNALLTERTHIRTEHRDFVNSERARIADEIIQDFASRGAVATKKYIADHITMNHAPSWERELESKINDSKQKDKDGWIPYKNMRSLHDHGGLSLSQVGHACFMEAISLNRSHEPTKVGQVLFSFDDINIRLKVETTIFGRSVHVIAEPSGNYRDIHLNASAEVRGYDKEINKAAEASLGIVVNNLVNRLIDECHITKSKLKEAQSYVDGVNEKTNTEGGVDESKVLLMRSYFDRVLSSCVVAMRTGFTDWSAFSLASNLASKMDIESYKGQQNNNLESIIAHDNTIDESKKLIVLKEVERAINSEPLLEVIKSMPKESLSPIQHWIDNRLSIIDFAQKNKVFDPVFDTKEVERPSIDGAKKPASGLA